MKGVIKMESSFTADNDLSLINNQITTRFNFNNQKIEVYLYQDKLYLLAIDILRIVGFKYPSHIVQYKLPKNEIQKMSKRKNGISIQYTVDLLDYLNEWENNPFRIDFQKAKRIAQQLKTWLLVVFNEYIDTQELNCHTAIIKEDASKMVTLKYNNLANFKTIPLYQNLYINILDLQGLIGTNLAYEILNDNLSEPYTVIFDNQLCLIMVNMTAVLKHLVNQRELQIPSIKLKDFRLWLTKQMGNIIKNNPNQDAKSLAGTNASEASLNNQDKHDNLYHFENNDIRTVMHNNHVYFVGKDITRLLGYMNSNETLRRKIMPDDKIMADYPDRNGHIQKGVCINEVGLYSLVLSSNTKIAKRLKTWLSQQALPYLRQCEVLSEQEDDKATNENPSNIEKTNTDDFVKSIFKLLNSNPDKPIESSTKITKQNEQDKLDASSDSKNQSYYDKILNSDELLTTSEIAKEYGLTAQALNNILYNLHIQYQRGSVWLLYEEYSQFGYTKLSTMFNKQTGKRYTFTKWTQKGRKFIYDRLKDVGIVPLIEKPTQSELDM